MKKTNEAGGFGGLLFGIFAVLIVICMINSVCTKAYGVHYTPQPAGGADVAP